MLKSGKFRKMTGNWLKLLVWLVALIGVVSVQSGAFRPVEVEASINVTATVNGPVIEKVLPAAGPVAGNTRVTISGANFSEVIAVTFGGVNVQSFTIVSPTSISALTPPGQAGQVKVVVITAGKAVALDNGFTYMAPLSPTATPSPTPTGSPTLTVTAAGAGSSPTPGPPTPPEGQITGTAQPDNSPGSGTGTSPTGSPVIVTATPTASVSPQPATAAPGGSPTTAVTTSPTGSAVVTPPAVETSPAATVTPGPTATLRPVVTATLTPTLAPTTTTLPGPSPSAQAYPVSPTPALTLTPTSPEISPTATVTAQPPITLANVSNSPSSGTPVGSVTASPSPSPSVSSGTPTATVEATGTPQISPTSTVIIAPTPTLVIDPSPTLVIAPSPTMALTPAAGTASVSPGVSVSPSPSPAVPAGPPVVTKISPATGPTLGGTTVIISGENFTDQTQVTFGGLNPTSVTVNSPTRITVVTAPQPAGAVSVVVKTEVGLAALSNGFSYTAGTVVISQAPTNFNYSGKLTGKILTLKSAFSVGVSDTTGSGAGWRLVARSTVLSSGKAVIPVANHTIQNVKVVTKSGLPPVNKLAYPLIFPTDDDTIFSAGANSGSGESIITFETQLVIPPDIPAGNYTLTLNVEVVAGA